MNVCCRSDDCKYFAEGYCTADIISLSENNECEDYESYLDSADWKQPFWKRGQDRKTKEVFRFIAYGKEIELHGRKFFVESKSDYATVTDAITGYGCCNRCDLEKRFCDIVKKIVDNDLDKPPLESLPVKEGEQK